MAVDFSIVTDAAFASFGIPALYRPKGGEPAIACTIVWTQPDQFLDLGPGKAIGATGATADIRLTEIAALAEGDAFDIGTDTWIVRGPPTRDSQHLTWRCRLAMQT